MRLLVDTHLVYWFFYESKRVPKTARKIMNEADEVFVSAVSIWEIAIKSRLGKLNANPRRIVDHIDLSGFRELPVFSRHAAAVADLPYHHNDPFDRLLIAQAISEPMRLLTADGKLTQYSDLVIHV